MKQLYYYVGPLGCDYDDGFSIYLSDRSDGTMSFDGYAIFHAIEKLDIQKIPHNQLSKAIEQIEGVRECVPLDRSVEYYWDNGEKKARVTPYKIYVKVHKGVDALSLVSSTVKAVEDYLNDGSGIKMTESQGVINVIPSLGVCDRY